MIVIGGIRAKVDAGGRVRVAGNIEASIIVNFSGIVRANFEVEACAAVDVGVVETTIGG